ncbi:MAG: tRNA (uridine(34)/cytosine(34)/5-carboxymethylaminomethyluridine(34)-2'-O)-methyltransferase TrmL [Clostridiales bacterium GWF2_36_10]|nr:MAG: tRNA (uridine(34)/cytosine(34)/5-carboxymethylaminomethyluridine(34)-2'-O)-methyltransferase TrmL [Clostridiales bacterium GWF2_36_10]HAN20900.1 tRNA (uridine(34)/cytosine(34)/5-carboxymethylaminomethyluridine(34)-2'-O)-methyltransferase TrmL [Clostridiales bacterium]
MSDINIVLLEPEIPQNTGNISRTCAATGSSLHLIEPLGFTITDRQLKRAGLDYWSHLDIHYYKDLNDFYSKNTDGFFYYFTTKAAINYTDVKYEGKVFLFFGKETKGLPEELLLKNKESCVRIPMLGELRSLNLSNSAAIAVYEVLRQRDFEGLNLKGKLFL